MIAVENLHYAYPGAAGDAVKGMTFRVPPGEIFGFLGPSGAGKSTTLKILTGLLKGFRGSVEVLGGSPAAHSRDIFERIGVSFESPNLYGKLTAQENLAFFASLYAGKTLPPAELLARVGLAPAAHQRVAHFSKGMKMRLNFARSLLNDPDVLFLDEPTTGLDPANARMVREIVLEQKARGKTIFLTTHNMTVAEMLADQVAFIVDGEIRRIGVPAELMREGGEPRVRVVYGKNGATDTREFEMKGLGENTAFLSLLRKQPVQSIHTLDATLEDVFIRVTGKGLQ